MPAARSVAWLLLLIESAAWGSQPGALDDPPWATADRAGPLSAADTRHFARELAGYVFDHHLKKTDSPQRGMVYEYFFVPRKGEFDQFIQGEGLDTMHDGAWLAAALVGAYRATGDDFYKEFVTRWQLPFYLSMLNRSDELFDGERNDAKPGSRPWGKEWALQGREKGFVPYFWDDGGSVSLDRLSQKSERASFPCADFLAGQPNPQRRLSGYSLGSSNHLAQDLAVMLQQAWLLLRGGTSAEQRRAAEVATAARNLHQCRMRHFGRIPACVAAAALSGGDAALMRHVPAWRSPAEGELPAKHYPAMLYAPTADKVEETPGFADDQQYRYYSGLAANAGRVPPALAFRTIYDAYTAGLLYRVYSDDAETPPGINRFDLHPYRFKAGKPLDYRSDRKGPFGGPRPVGSRLGPQNMACCGWALQMLKAWPDLWEARYKDRFADDLRVEIADPAPGDPLRWRPAAWTTADAALEIAAKRTALRLAGTTTATPFKLAVFARPEGGGTWAEIVVATAGKAAEPTAGTVRATNHRGEELACRGTAAVDGAQARFEVEIPFGFVKGQAEWINGVEHGRYSIRLGDQTRNLYLASSAETVRRRLEYELGCGLQVWRAIFRQYGYVPTGINGGSLPFGKSVVWDDFSDSGGYAHLIAAAGQWLLYLEGKRDWELHDVPAIR